MSALPPKADIGGRRLNVRFVPKADSCTAAKSVFTETSEGDVRICAVSDFEAPSVFTLRFEGTEARYKVIWRNQQFVGAELAPQETSPVNPQRDCNFHRGRAPPVYGFDAFWPTSATSHTMTTVITTE
jgi:hypothetical protein